MGRDEGRADAGRTKQRRLRARIIRHAGYGRRMPGRLTLNIVGGVLEVGGFGQVAWELTRVQRQEFGTPRFVRALRGWMRRIQCP